VVALAQLNRAVELREEKRPRLADLRESGAIEQDADMVMFLHRPEAYGDDKRKREHHNAGPDLDDDGVDQRGLAELIVAKHRNGPTGIVNLTWIAESMRFVDRTQREEPVGAHLRVSDFDDSF